MTGTAIRFESFDCDENGPRHAHRYNQREYDAARLAGYDEGVAAGRGAGTQDLVAAIQRLAHSLGEDEMRLRAIRHNTVAAMAPILIEMLDAVASRGTAKRLEDTLLSEMRRLADAPTPPSCHVRCHASLRPMVEAAARAAGLTCLNLTECAAEETPSMTLNGGRIEFSQHSAAERIRRLIAETQEDEE